MVGYFTHELLMSLRFWQAGKIINKQETLYKTKVKTTTVSNIFMYITNT
jgi:hypothetical protein